jgi:hypothetical protein
MACAIIAAPIEDPNGCNLFDWQLHGCGGWAVHPVVISCFLRGERIHDYSPGENA